MYLPAHFAEQRPEVLQALMREHPLATLVTQSPAGLTANHIPMQFVPAGGAQGQDVLRAHVARNNPLWRESAAEVLAIFQGPQHYISPGWYPSKRETGKVVPTWNYCCVHVQGRLEVHDDPAWVHAQVEALTARHEAARAQPWAVSDAPEDYLRAMLGQIVGLQIAVTRIEGKWKMSQNQPAPNRGGVVQGLGALGEAQADAVAGIVRERAGGS